LCLSNHPIKAFRSGRKEDKKSHSSEEDGECGIDAGDRITRDPPYLSDTYSRRRLKQGLPIPVKSCWNGLVVLKAARFSQNGLRFR
jgi:hypothetical protein